VAVEALSLEQVEDQELMVVETVVEVSLEAMHLLILEVVAVVEDKVHLPVLKQEEMVVQE
tara:strand:+ start:653 stop:832 length:180 start_codon:yes stop_codon:yes gene_type:complete